MYSSYIIEYLFKKDALVCIILIHSTLFNSLIDRLIKTPYYLYGAGRDGRTALYVLKKYGGCTRCNVLRQ